MVTMTAPVQKHSRSSAPQHEREIVHPVDLCLPGGRLNPAATGWSRHPLQRCNLQGPWGRQKRWDFWSVTSQECALSVTYASLDYLGFAAVSFNDFASKRAYEHAMLVPFAIGFRQPEQVGGAVLAFNALGLRVRIDDRGNTVLIDAGIRRPGIPPVEAHAVITRPKGHETLNVVVPWSERRYQFTSKQNTLPATGEVRAGKQQFRFGPENQSFGCMDYGRGVWPYATTWNWATASGECGGHTVGLQFGGQWTDGTGSTENGICLDGRLHKISEDVCFDCDRRNFLKPWRIHSPGSDRVDLIFDPFIDRPLRAPLIVAGVDLHLCFGKFSGQVRLTDGKTLEVAGLIGTSEEMRARW